MKIFVGSLPFTIQEDVLSQYFEKYGEVSSASIIMDKFSGRSRGFGFVEMVNDQEAQKAIQELNGSEVGGRTIVVNQAEERRENTRSNNFGGPKDQGSYNKGGYNRGDNNNRGNYNKDGRKDRY